MNNLLIIDNYDPTIDEVSDRLSRVITRPLFFVLYVISPELLYHLCIISIAEQERKLKIPVEERLSDDKIITAVDHLATTLFVTKHELNAFMTILKNRVLDLAGKNSAQQIMNQLDGEKWK